jgi:osmotically-inducible protein OsmY
MKVTLISACFVAGALITPVAAYSADSYSNSSKKTEHSADTSTQKEGFKDSVKDTTITAMVKAEFAKDKQVSATNISVETNGTGVVTLTGSAKSKAEANRAVELARNTKGVTSVHNNIHVESTASAKPSNTGTSSSK